MKVIHINTYEGNGGAGRACLRLSDALKAHGTDSSVLVYYQFQKSEKSRAFSHSIFQKISAVYHILAERYLSKFLTKAALKTPFSLQWFGSNIASHPAVQSADIIHLHWVNHGFLKPSNLADLEELNKPIVWTFHDSNAFTGGCHVRYACENFHKQCGNCPLLKMSGKNDLSHWNWLKKKKGYANLDFHIIAPSNWMASSVRFSSLMGVRPQTVIPNTIETNVFKPYVKSEARRIFNIAPEKFVILSGFMPSKNDKHKGTAYLVEALNDLAKRPDIDPGNIELLIFGNKDGIEMPEFPFKTTLLGTISDDTQLAKCYSAADAFITPSLEDNLPNTVMESLACATPVIAFKTGGIPDMVNHLVNGYLAEYESAEDLATGMEWLYHEEHAPEIQKEARLTILKYFSEEVVAKQHQQLYQSLIDAHVY
ncbi:glycosyl transferase family 1 [Pedobacter antarcticus 4BY]|uniref:Glycosyl transferase family 1 n=2 Tax=Pedobacter antarcticus TaxID=34086 RepID=A0A081PFM3_9SPHI|nr:glycosyltransferase [Pedobacter antarcticus]KEQ29496.1 glycosyl transferase family 1 [Pedobacter antarcticus 4BY]SFF11168.1 Glycosyltransferase involved in cell wall bisynthesis [Pedobacter antarcticus]